MVTIDNIKTQYILPLLKSTGYDFHIVTDTGDYETAVRSRNTVSAPINGLLMLTQSEMQKLSGGMAAMAYTAILQFLLPVGDETDVNKEYPTVMEFRKALSIALSNAMKISVTDDEGEVYEGGVIYSLPIAGQRNQRDMAGDSVTYSCTISVSFLANALNTSDYSLQIDGEIVPFTSIRFKRSPALSADILSESEYGESSVYAENAAFSIEFGVPALKDVSNSVAVMKYILGLSDANEAHRVIVTTPNMGGAVGVLKRTWTMTFGGCELTGSGVSNTLYSVSLVPYTAPEIVGG